MPRIGRKAPGGLIYHVMNRGNGRQKIFHKDADYAAFIGILNSVQETLPVPILGYCLMPNHWHLVLHPTHDGDLSSFMLRLTTTHVRRHHAHYRRPSGGHLYQGRFKSFPVQDDVHLLTLLRYVEGNPLRAELTRRAEDWPWTSFAARENNADDWLSPWPVKRPSGWAGLLEERLPKLQLEHVTRSLQRGRPMGGDSWTNDVAQTLGLAFTLNPRGRPKRNADQGK